MAKAHTIVRPAIMVLKSVSGIEDWSTLGCLAPLALPCQAEALWNMLQSLTHRKESP